MAKIQFTIDGPRGGVTLRAMLLAFHNQLNILSDLDATIAGRGSPLLDWVVFDINAKASVTGTLQSRPLTEDVPLNHESRVENAYRNGWRVIEGGARTPEYYTVRSLRSSKSTLQLIGDDGITGFTVEDDLHPDDLPTKLTPVGAVNLESLIKPGLTSYGSVEGTLTAISVRTKKPKFEIVTSIAKKAVSCKFDSSLLDDIKAALGHRVIVAGEVVHNSKGEPQKIRMDGPIRMLRAASELPSTREMTGAFPDLLGGMTTAEYMELVRG
ncbi:MAG TPA: hypothetical protein VN380_21340 [Thermoanaerobaculia bacterium]|jgi:hypothetical protein|nr:hypothetical protein [Thermoanaerobaculia bacterium]